VPHIEWVTQQFQRQRYALGYEAVLLLHRHFRRQRDDDYDYEYDIVFAVSPGLGECRVRRYEALAGDGKPNQASLPIWTGGAEVIGSWRTAEIVPAQPFWFWGYRVWRSTPDPDAPGLSPKTVCGRRRNELHLLFIAARQANTKAAVHSAAAVAACGGEEHTT
jgi:hypothetical protein